MERETSISVVMVFHNAEQYIKDAINSILNQSFKNYELILINDGSTDKSITIINGFNDKRIRIINNKHDYIASLNLGLEIARGKYIARMDADDIMHPDRLLVQFRLMEDKTEIDFCSSWCTLFANTSGHTLDNKALSGKIDNPLVSLLRKNIFTHSSMMFKTNFIKKNKLKYLYYSHAEDYKLWVEAAKLGATFYVESQILLYYRVHDLQVSCINREEQEQTSYQIKEEIMEYLIPRIPKELETLHEILHKMETRGLVKSGYRFALMYDILKYNKIKI